MILLSILNLLIHKTDKKQNIIMWFCLNIMVIFCYNIFICTIFSFLKIKCTLQNISIINIIFSTILIFKICKDKKIQKYYFKKRDIIYIIILFTITVGICIKQYKIPFNVKYEVTDGSIHYFAANNFSKFSTTVFNENSDYLNWWGFEGLMPGAYINLGLLFKIFGNFISEAYFIYLYVIFDMIILFLSGAIFYFTISKEKNNILTYIFPILYMIGYPLNSIFSGFQYLHLGLNIILTIFLIFKIKEEKEVNKNYILIILSLLTYAIFFSYYLFMPVVYLSILIYFIIEKKKSIINIENLTQILFVLVIPSFFGLLYFVVPYLLKSKGIPAGAIGTDGYIYKNFITNILLFLPFSVYYVVKNIKNKKNSFSSKILVFTILFMVILFIGKAIGKVSNYYFYKVYYLLWIPVLYTAKQGLDILYEKGKLNKILITIGTIIYIVIAIISVRFNNKESLFDIFKVNFQIINYDDNIVENKELELFDYYFKNLPKVQNKIYICSPYTYSRAYWLYSISQDPYLFLHTVYAEETTTIQQFIESNDIYAIILYRDYKGESNFKEYNLETLFENETGIILKKISE